MEGLFRDLQISLDLSGSTKRQKSPKREMVEMHAFWLWVEWGKISPGISNHEALLM